METFENVTVFIRDYIVANDFFIAFVLFVALYFCIRMVFPQFRLFIETFRCLSDKKKQEQGISPFQAFATSLGSRIGVGNIAGVATAIATGGPGAIFWIWVIGLLGSAIAIVEAILGQAFKVKDGDEFLGGPAYYIKRGFKNKKVAGILSTIFAVIGVIAYGILMPGVQSNTVVNSITHGFGFDKTITVIVTAICIAIIIWGGIKRIGIIESVVTPIKCFGYLLFALIVIVYYNQYLGLVFSYIFSSAFGANAIFGGIVGSAISMGVKRGILCTDVGFGPGAIFASAARTEHPVKQGLLQGLSVLISTLLICTATALVILLSGSFDVEDNAGNIIYQAVDYPGISAGAEWVQNGLNGVPILNGWSPQLLAAIVALFAIGTTIGYYYLVETNLKFLVKKANKVLIRVVKIVFIAVLVFSTVIDSTLSWSLLDVGLGLVGWINLIALLVLSPLACKILKDYTKARKEKIEPVFVPENYGINDETGAWKD